MQSKEELINEFSALISFVKSIRDLDDETWVSPIAEGKWTTRDIIAHIMLWDKYFLENAIERITNRKVISAKHLDFDEFNKEAVEYAKETSKEEILDKTIYYRNQLIRHINEMSDAEFLGEHMDGDGNKFSAYHYLIGFIPHDEHHIRQIKEFLGDLLLVKSSE